MDIFIDLFQGIMLLLLYLTLIIRSILIYLKDGINPFVLGKGKKGFQKIIEYLFIVGLLVWTYEIITSLFCINVHIIPVPFINNIIIDNIIMEYIGVIIIVIGYIIFVLSLIAFGNSWRIGIDKNNPGKLVQSGIFSITRNPIFVYMDLYYIGTAMINPNLFFIIFALIVIIGLHYQILLEEKYLESKYGREYLEYKGKVRRYL